MNPINFVYWLQGFLEIGDPKSLNEVQIQEIRNHIGLVLDKQTPLQTVLFKHNEVNKNKDIFNIQLGESGVIPRYPTVIYYNHKQDTYKDWFGNPFHVSYNDPPASC